MRIYSDKKVEAKGYVIHLASVDLSQIKKGDVLTSSLKETLNQLIKDYKISTPNKDLLYKDFVENQDNFAIMFEANKEYWKRAYKNRFGD